MLKTFSLRGRERPLTVYGPRGLGALFAGLKPVIGKTTFPIRLAELSPNDELDRDGYRIAAFEVDHSAQSIGYAIVEEERPGHLDAARAEELGVTPGPDFGRLQRGEAVNGVTPDQVMGEPRRGRKIVLAGDTAPCEMTRLVAFQADLLIHEATFLEEEAQRAAETRHSTARAAARLADEAEVHMLALTHVSPRYGGGELREEARTVFDNTIVPRDFDAVELPFPERGEPVHVRASERREPAPEPAVPPR
jgi:ribonuclease Z